jgi:hypothetical protein
LFKKELHFITKIKIKNIHILLVRQSSSRFAGYLPAKGAGCVGIYRIEG